MLCVTTVPIMVCIDSFFCTVWLRAPTWLCTCVNRGYVLSNPAGLSTLPSGSLGSNLALICDYSMLYMEPMVFVDQDCITRNKHEFQKSDILNFK